MTLSTDRLLKLDTAAVGKMPNEELAEAVRELLALQQADRKETQILFYRPASPRAAAIHRSQARVIGVGGGNGSGKTESVLAEVVALATGILPNEFRADLLPKFRGPVQCRMVVESLTTTLEQAILPKLQWWKWTGVDQEGGERGHYGWIPKTSLKDGSWDKSWHAKLRTLTVLCRDPEDPEKILGESTFQFMSHDQDPADFASGDFHHVIHDEPPRLAIWTENEARTMRVAGRLYLSMTWPDDPTIPVDWIFDQIYDKGVQGPNKTKGIDWFELWTTDNVNLNQDAIRTQMGQWDNTKKDVRIYGKPIRFSNRIHPLFTDIPLNWSFTAGKVIVPDEKGLCPETGSSDVVEFCHVEDFEPSCLWPTVFILDPHPRKPHMFMWAQVRPDDDLDVIEEGEMDGDADTVRDYVFRTEEAHRLQISDRIMDPNMGATPTAKREITWQDEFDNARLSCVLADDSSVGRQRLNAYLTPDKQTLRPRIRFRPNCTTTIFQLKRYVWDNYRRADEKALKEVAKTKNDDYPTMLKYLMNTTPSYRMLHGGAPVVRYNRGYDSRTAVRTR
jgi:hypothetical protein